MRSAFGTALFGLGLGLLTAGCSPAAGRLRVATTPAIAASDVWRDVMTAFARETGLHFDLMPVGSATALALAARGDVALAMVDSLTDQTAFVVRGHARRAQALGWHRYVLAGPASDPAGVRGQSIVAALQAIAAKGVPFVGQPTRSGVDRLERDLWVRAGLQPQGAWYRAVAASTAETLRVAAACQGYVLCEAAALRRTATSGLQVLVDSDPALLVPVSLLPGTRDQDDERQQRLVEFLASPAGRAKLQQAGIVPWATGASDATAQAHSAQSI